MKNIFTRISNKVVLIIGIVIIALLFFGTITYAFVPDFQDFVKSTVGIQEKEITIPNDNGPIVTEEDNTSDASQQTVATEEPEENKDANTTTPKTSTPTPTPTPKPAPIVFRVSSVTASVSPTTSPISPCPQTFHFTFTGTITTTAAGTVNYNWVRSDGGSVGGTLVFGSAGSRTVTYDWSTNLPADSGSRSGKLVVSSPNSISSSPASFTRLMCY